MSSCKAPEIKPDIKYDISFKFNRCQLKCFDIAKMTHLDDRFCGDSFVSGDYPIERCEGIIGFHYSTVAEKIKPWAVELEEWAEDTCK